MSFLRSGGIYAAGNIAASAVPFLMLPLLTRVLSPAEYGQVVGFSLLVTLCLILAGINTHATLGVVWFKKPRSEMPAFIGTAIGLSLGSTALIALFAAVVLSRWPTLAPGITPIWGALAALTAGAGVILQCRLILWQSQQQPLRNVGLQFSSSFFNVGISLVAVLALGLGSAGRNGGIVLAALLMSMVSIILFVRAGEIRWSPARSQVRELLAFGLPLSLHTLAGVLLSTTDRWAVSVHLGVHALGVYGAGAQLGMVMGILADAFVKAYAPWIYSRLATKHDSDKQVVVGAVYVAMPSFFMAAAVVGIALQWASTLLLGAKYQEAAVVLPWFMVGGAFSGVYLCTSVLFFFSARTGLLSLTTASAAICGALCTWLLVADYGIDGAAIGYATTQALLALFTTVVAMRSFDLPWSKPLQALRAWRKCAFSSQELIPSPTKEIGQ